MTVNDVLEYLASGMSHEEILSDFPSLTEADIRACLAFAAGRETKNESWLGEAWQSLTPNSRHRGKF